MERSLYADREHGGEERDEVRETTQLGIGTEPFQVAAQPPGPAPDDAVPLTAEAEGSHGRPVTAPAAHATTDDEDAPGAGGDAGDGGGEVRPSETPESTETEQEALWKQTQPAKPRWYQRSSLRALLVVAALTAAASIIHYPLYITSECAIVPNARAYVRAPIAGVIAEILVDEGARVHKGDVIARLDDRQLRADRRKAIAETERIAAELQRLRRGARPEEISQQRAVLDARRTAADFAQKEAMRRNDMVEAGVGSLQARDEAQLDLQIKKNAASEAAAALRLVQAGSRPEEIAAREAELRRARAGLEFIEQQLAEMVVIRAPMDGVLLTPRFRERLHENVEAGGLVCEIADTSSVRAEIFVIEREADSIAVGMPAVVKVESYPLRPFDGKVGFIAPAVEIRDRINVIRVEATLDNRDGLLRQDMSGYGEVECGRRSLLDLATRRFLRWIRVRFLI